MSPAQAPEALMAVRTDIKPRTICVSKISERCRHRTHNFSDLPPGKPLTVLLFALTSLFSTSVSLRSESLTQKRYTFFTRSTSSSVMHFMQIWFPRPGSSKRKRSGPALLLSYAGTYLQKKRHWRPPDGELTGKSLTSFGEADKSRPGYTSNL